MPDLIGKTLGPYRIISQIGLGGMATVYKAYQPSMDRYVALKVLSTHFAQDPAFIKRFQQEAKIIARLEHAHILPVYDHGEEDGYLYLVMRYIEAGTLKDRLKQRPLALAESRRVVAQVGSALEYAHQLGIVHRDIKPSNVLVDPQDNCYLTDFGIAKMIEGTLGLTGSGVIGTPHYMAPEQSKSAGVDQRADIYAMGVIIYEMVTGRLPFDADTPFAVVIKHMIEPLPLPRAIKPDVPEAVERVILKSLAKDPADRYQRMHELVSALDQAVQSSAASAPTVASQPQVQSAPTLAAATMRAPEPVPVPAPAWKRGLAARPMWQWGLATLVVVALVIAGVALSQVQRAPVAGTALPLATSTAAVAGVFPATVAPPAALATVAPDAPFKPILSPADQVRAFADPILQAIASRKPDYQDDFRDPGSGWPVGSSPEGDRWGYENNAYVIAATYLPRIQGGCCIGATPEHGPQLSDFVLDIQVRFVVSGEEGRWQVLFRQSPQVADQGGGYSVGFHPDGRLRVTKNVRGLHTDLEAGRYVPTFRPGYDVNRLTIVAQGPRIAIYVNQEPVWLIEDSSIARGSIILGVENMSATGKLFQAQFDNLRIWDIANVPAAAPAPGLQGEQARAFAEPILKAIANRSPDFQDDFSAANKGWQTAGDKGAFAITIQDGVARLRAEKAGAYLGHEMLNRKDLVLQMDARLIEGDKEAEWQVMFHNLSGEHWYAINLNSVLRTWYVKKRLAGQEYQLASGAGNVSPPGETTRIVVVTRGPRAAFYLNETPVAYFEEADFDTSGNTLLWCMSSGQVVCEFDNVKFWNLDNVPGLPPVVATPGSKAEQIRALAEPILKAIAGKQPDYQDDFSSPRSGWWQVESADKGRSGYADGEFFMITNPPPLSPGWQCNVATGPWPKLTDFVLEADMRLVSGKQVSSQIQFRVWDSPIKQQGGGYVLGFDSEGFGLMKCQDKGCPNLGNYSGSAVRRGTEWNHIQIVARGARVMVHVNGEPAMYFEDRNDSQDFRSGRLNLVACNMSNAPQEARWDNLRIWDVSKVLGPASPLIPDPVTAQARAFGDPILKAIANQPPTFQDDFGNPKSGWPQVESMDRGRFGYVDGEYSLVAKATLGATPVECNGVTAPVRELGDFVLNVDGRFASGKGGNAIMAFRQWRTADRGSGGYELHLSRPNEAATLRRCDSNGCPEVKDYFGNATKTSTAWNHWQIIARGSRLAVYANGEPILYLDDSKFTPEHGSGRFELKVCNVGDVPSEVRWDNVKIWDISRLP